VTYHQDCGIPFHSWLGNVEPLKRRPHILQTIVANIRHRVWAEEHGPRLISDSWNFKTETDRAPFNQTRGGWVAATDAAEVASKMITLIVPNGNVYPCNSTKKGPIGNVFGMTCDDRKARSLDKHAEFCALNNRCSAFLTARAVESLPLPTEGE
jgi:sulfatase maturation enzyme AslB (radical SAM superfamily)